MIHSGCPPSFPSCPTRSGIPHSQNFSMNSFASGYFLYYTLIFSCFAFAILFTGISPSLLSAESFLFSEALKSSNCPMCKCVFVLICKYTNAQMCVCVYVLMHLCSCVLMYLCAYMLKCEYINMSISKYVCVPMC